MLPTVFYTLHVLSENLIQSKNILKITDTTRHVLKFSLATKCIITLKLTISNYEYEEKYLNYFAQYCILNTVFYALMH